MGISESGWPNLTGREGILRTEARRGVYSQKTTWDPRLYWRPETEDPPGSWLQRAQLRTQERTKVSAPPLWNHLKLQKPTDREGKRYRTQVRIKTEIPTKEGPDRPKKGTDRKIHRQSN